MQNQHSLVCPTKLRHCAQLSALRPSHSRLRNLLALAFLASVGGILVAETPVALKNSGFEEGAGKPTAWEQGSPVPGVQFIWDRKVAHTGKASLSLIKTAQRYFPIAQWTQSITVEPASKARKLRVKCWVKAQSVTKAIVDVAYRGEQVRSGHVWAVYLGQKKDTDPVLTHDWKAYENAVDVPAHVSEIGIGLQIYGPGSVWFDDLQVSWVE